jgi:ribosomal protein L18E
MTTSSQPSSPHSFFTRFPWHLASIALRRTFEHWIKVGAGLRLLRQKADQIGTRNAFNDLRNQHRLGEKHLRKAVACRLLKIMDNLAAVDIFVLDAKDKVEIIAGKVIEKVGVDKAVKIARAILNSDELE